MTRKPAMSPRAKTRLISLILIVLGLSLSVAFTLYGLSGRITYFYSPHEVASGKIPAPALARSFRLGGLVVENSFKSEGLKHSFSVTDYNANIKVEYEGLLPTLFREGQGVVANGIYNPDTEIFTASSILARHDENYMPPQINKILQDNGQ